jgi:hypothetical protein
VCREWHAAFGPEEQINTERHATARDINAGVADSSAGRAVALFIKFTIVRKIDLRHGADDLTVMDCDCAIEQLASAAQRGTNKQNRKYIARAFRNLFECPLDFVEQRILKQ